MRRQSTSVVFHHALQQQDHIMLVSHKGDHDTLPQQVVSEIVYIHPADNDRGSLSAQVPKRTTWPSPIAKATPSAGFAIGVAMILAWCLEPDDSSTSQ
jgi:hypothetical protein